MDAQQMIMSIFVLARSNEESKRKSERCAAVAEQARERARTGKPTTKRVPGWIRVKEDYSGFELIPSYAATVRTVYRMALNGYGANLICDHLIKNKAETWTTKGRWSPDYVSALLRDRKVTGEYQQGKCPRGMRRTVVGEPILNYFPKVIDELTWQKVQNQRASNWGHGLSVGNRKGKGRTSWRNIFAGLLYDQDGNSVIYKQTNWTWEYLMSSDRSKFATHKVRYDKFKTAILNLLKNDIDWLSLVEDSDPQIRIELAEIEAEIQKNDARLDRYSKMLDLDDNAPELLLNKIKIAEREAKDLQLQHERLQSRAISNQSLKTGIPTITVNQTVRESNLKLREEIRRRISRIDLAFGATVLTTPGVTEVKPGKMQVVAKIKFVNGSVKFAFIDGDKAVLMS
jgi:hypothetical protein